MGAIRLDSLLDFFRGTSLMVAVLLLGLGFLISALLVLMYTRWGTLKPLRKCLVLSLLAHLLLAGYSTTVYVVPAIPFLREQIIHVSLADNLPDASGNLAAPAAGQRPRASRSAADSKPWETFALSSGPTLSPIDPPRAAVKGPPIPERTPKAVSSDLGGATVLAQMPLAQIPAPEAKPPALQTQTPKATPERPVEPIQAPAPQSRQGARAGLPNQPQLAPLTPIDRKAHSAQRTANTNVPSSLLERPIEPPKLRDLSANTDPRRPPAAMVDASAPKGSARPAEPATAAKTQGEGPLSIPEPARSVSGPSLSRMASSASHLKPPSMADDSWQSAGGGGDGPAASSQDTADLGPPRLPRGPRAQGEYQVPEVYRMRVAPNRSQLSQRLGATPELETAVKAALQWLADNQEKDGRWNVRRHGGGRELYEASRDREGAGAQADTGVTGLAILAFAASGHTHQDGSQRASVRRGLDYLLSVQAENGSLGGEARMYEFMYCHGMATLALSELAAMTGDERLRRPVARAIAYTLAAQDPSGGGWRYRAREAGDMSQLGWQLMALKSADLAGIAVPETAWRGARRFLDSVSGGRSHGLAAYRPGEEFSRSMTAEALACRQFLGLPRESSTAKEAGDSLLGELPGDGQPNLYYWYYGSIAMYQLQGDYWKRWSEALQKTLLATQRTSGPLAGSWDPNTRWDGYGGRVYSTALAALCLEAHYRFLPLNFPSQAASESPGRK